MEEAARMKSDAEKSLAEYEQKLASIDQEIERVRREMRAAGESERVRILADARARRERMERDARLLVEQGAPRGTLAGSGEKRHKSASVTLRERMRRAAAGARTSSSRVCPRLEPPCAAGCESKMSSIATIADRYARAIFAIGVETGEVAALAEQIGDFARTYAGSLDLKAVIQNPLVEAGQRENILREVASRLGLGPAALNVVRYLASRGRLMALPDIARRLGSLSDEREGVVRAHVTSAGPLPESYYTRLSEELARLVGRKSGSTHEDPSLMPA